MSETPETDSTSPDRIEGLCMVFEAERNKYRRAIELIAEDCESWSGVETDVGGYSFVKAVAKYAREVLQ
jgi:hypothetical protein